MLRICHEPHFRSVEIEEWQKACRINSRLGMEKSILCLKLQTGPAAQLFQTQNIAELVKY